jgi:hypothetical protein
LEVVTCSTKKFALRIWKLGNSIILKSSLQGVLCLFLAIVQSLPSLPTNSPKRFLHLLNSVLSHVDRIHHGIVRLCPDRLTVRRF